MFNPIKQEEDGKKARRVIWSTESLKLALDGIRKGRRLLANPFYENDTKLIKADLVFQRTNEEIEEWKRCKNDIIYFCNKYCKLMTPKGISHITLRDYQEKYLKHLMNHRLSIMLAARQVGKTVTSALFMLHYICFNVDKNALVVGNKLKTAKEILDKLKKIFIELPYFLRPGVRKWNETQIVLDNDCMCMAEATTINSGISFTFHCVSYLTHIKIKINNIILKNKLINKKYKEYQLNCFEIPMFELKNLYTQGFFWKVNYKLLRIMYICRSKFR